MILIFDEAFVHKFTNPSDITDAEIDGIVEKFTDVETTLKRYNIKSDVGFTGNGVSIYIFAQKLHMSESDVAAIFKSVLYPVFDFNFKVEVSTTDTEMKLFLTPK